MKPGEHELQMSESLSVMAFLTMSGGLQDTYSYMMRDQVFANAQTGNIVLMSCNLVSGNFGVCMKYLIPLLAFSGGVIAADMIRAACTMEGRRIHWRQIVLLMQILMLAAVGLLPTQWNWLANAMTSFSCAMQVQSFRSVKGSAYASTMCIGNLRSSMAHLSQSILRRDWKEFREAGKYGVVILFFAFGAGMGGALTKILGLKTIWVSCELLSVGFLLMLVQSKIVEE